MARCSRDRPVPLVGRGSLAERYFAALVIQEQTTPTKACAPLFPASSPQSTFLLGCLWTRPDRCL